MIKRGRPKIYYDCLDSAKKTEEPLDLLLMYNFITVIQHGLACKVRWLFTLSFGLPTVQAYNISRVKGKRAPKYDEESLHEKRQEYKRIVEFLYAEDREAAKIFLNIVLYHKVPNIKQKQNIAMIKTAAINLERAYRMKKKTQHIIPQQEYGCAYAN